MIMNEPLSNIIFDDIRNKILDIFGLNFSFNQNKEIMEKFGKASKELEFSGTEKFIEQFLHDELTSQQKNVLANHITIGETYFFREKKSFDFLEKIYLPNLIQKRFTNFRKIRIWSAGCASGEEAYSLAIMLYRTIPNLKNWDVSIIATDINTEFLEKAKNGIYKKWSFRGLSDTTIDKYFQKAGNNAFSIIPEIKNMVKFSILNLVEDSYPSENSDTIGMDIIFCRNVFIYFSQKAIEDVSKRFQKSLIKGGILIVSPVEMSNILSRKFGKIDYSGFTIYQKGLEKTKEKRIPERTIETKIKQPFDFHTVPKTELVQKNISEPKRVLDNAKIEEGIETNNIAKFEDAMALFEKGSYEETEKVLSELLNSDTKNKNSIMHLLAKTKANMGKLEEAGNLCVSILKTDKFNLSMYFLLATIQQEMGNNKDAIASLNKAIYLDSKFVMAHFLLGNLVMKTGGNGSGIKHFKNALNILSKHNPKDLLPESDGLTAGKLLEIINAIKT